MFARTAETLTKKLKENNTITAEQYEICRYGFQQGLTIILNAVTTIAIGVVFDELWQAVLFMAAYAPLRSYAGGYHAKTAERCYVYSILLMIAVLLAIKYVALPNFICIITLLISCTVIAVLAPVEDSNKPLDSLEQVVYRKTTLMITAIEIIMFFISLTLGWKEMALCIVWVLAVMAVMLLGGKWKNRRTKGLFC